MRAFVLVLFEIAVLFGIPRMVNELRAALGEAPPATAVAVRPANESRSISIAGTKAALAKEIEKVQLLQVSLQPSARTVANLQPLPQAHVSAKESPVKEGVAAARDDDYLPPWMRGVGAAPPLASPAASVQAPVAVKKAGAAKQAGHKRRRSEKGLNAYANSSRHARQRSIWAMDF